mmetsp:Transcript_43554/g.144165  ORF Transcript_43554/g.144165 Transcript_43554/m.144165 type:complete len:202 (-) Transcript_43554:1057-1662(-)
MSRQWRTADGAALSRRRQQRWDAIAGRGVRGILRAVVARRGAGAGQRAQPLARETKVGEELEPRRRRARPVRRMCRLRQRGRRSAGGSGRGARGARGCGGATGAARGAARAIRGRPLPHQDGLPQGAPLGGPPRRRRLGRCVHIRLRLPSKRRECRRVVRGQRVARSCATSAVAVAVAVAINAAASPSPAAPSAAATRIVL